MVQILDNREIESLAFGTRPCLAGRPHSFEDYKAALQDTPSERIREELLAEADRGGRFSPWQMAELSMVREELWA